MRAASGHDGPFLTPAQVQLRYGQEHGETGREAFDNLFHLFEIRGALEVDLLEQAIDLVVQATPVLRAAVVGRRWPRLVPRAARFALQEGTDPGETAARCLDAVVGRRFADDEVPRVRGRVVRTGPRSTMIALAGDHLVIDPESWGILLDEVGLAYEASRLGVPVQPAGGVDFLAHARHVTTRAERLAQDERGEQLATYLSGFSGNGWLVDGPRHGSRRTIVRRVVDTAARDAMARRAQADGITRFTATASALAAALAPLGGEELLLASVGTARPGPSHARTIGLYATPAFVRVPVPSDRELGAVHAAVAHGVALSLQCSPYSVGRLLELVDGDRLLGSDRHPRVLLHYFQEGSGLRLPGCDVTRAVDAEAEVGTASMADLHILVFDRPEGLTIDVRCRDWPWRFAPEALAADLETRLVGGHADAVGAVLAGG